jgi:hypothetical protein
MTPEKNLELMKTLDDSWNSQDLTVFRKRHTKTASFAGPTSRLPSALKRMSRKQSHSFRHFLTSISSTIPTK